MIEIRSYRRVFDLERRIYSVDRLQLNPGGVPVRGVLYFLAAVVIALLIGGLPVIGAPLREVPWYLSDLAMPAALASVLSAIRVEGRTFHLAARALISHAMGPRWLSGLRPSVRSGQRWDPPMLLMLPDGSDPRMRRMRYKGPGAVLVAVGHERSGRSCERGASGIARPGFGAALTLRQRGSVAPRQAEVISLRRGASVSVLADRAERG